MCNAQCGCVNMYLLHTVENLFATLRAMAFLKVAAALEGSLPQQDPPWVLSRADLAPSDRRERPQGTNSDQTGTAIAMTRGAP